MQVQTSDRQRLERLSTALVAQQWALLCQDGSALERATAELNTTLTGLESSEGRDLSASDLDVLLKVHALAQTNRWLLSTWHNWSQEIRAALSREGVELLKATC